jgi:hypothetical protein
MIYPTGILQNVQLLLVIPLCGIVRHISISKSTPAMCTWDLHSWIRHLSPERKQELEAAAHGPWDAI